jgi:predicted deacylase
MRTKNDFSKYHNLQINSQKFSPNSIRDLHLKISESFTGKEIEIPLQVHYGSEAGPVLFISGAIHGDEVNGPGIIHELILNENFKLQRGALILAPVVNLPGFERHSRYLPDRRDLNRYFPGNSDGSLASRIAHVIFAGIVAKCDYGIDIHAAAADRTNYPNVRANLKIPAVRKLAKAFGSELIINSAGPAGSLRKEACKIGCATICFEAGEILKLRNNVLNSGLTGIYNVLAMLGTHEQKIKKPNYQTQVDHSFWLRAHEGGFIKFTAKLGQPLTQGEEIARICDLMGKECRQVIAPCDAIVMGLSTMPLVRPGYPIAHLAVPITSISDIKAKLEKKLLNKRA